MLHFHNEVEIKSFFTEYSGIKEFEITEFTGRERLAVDTIINQIPMDFQLQERHRGIKLPSPYLSGGIL